MASQQEHFCYRFIKLKQQAYISFGLYIIVSMILWYAIRQYIKAKRINMISKNIRWIYITIFSWAAAYLIKLIVSQILFWEFLDLQNQDSYPTFAKYVFTIDLLGVFLLQAILILVVYNWMDNILIIFKQISQMEDSSQEKKKQSRNYFKFQTICRQLLSIYLIGRFVFFAILLSFFIFPTAQCSLVWIMLSLLIFQAFCVLVIMILGILAIKKNSKLAQLVDQQQISLMLRKYLILLACAVIRSGIDAAFLFFYFKNCLRLPEKYCKIQTNPPQQDYKPFLSLTNIILQGLFAHALPVLVVLRIYRVQQKNVDLTESLLAAQQYNQSGNTDSIIKDK